MTVKELKKLLESYDDHIIVLSSSDAEGNEFNKVSQVEFCTYAEYGHEIEIEDGSHTEPCIVIWP